MNCEIYALFMEVSTSLKYGFCKKYFDRNEPRTSWTLLSPVFSRSALIHFYWSNFLQNPYFRYSFLNFEIVAANFKGGNYMRKYGSLRLIRIFVLLWNSIPWTSWHFETKANDFNHAQNTHAWKESKCPTNDCQFITECVSLLPPRDRSYIT